MAKPFRRGDEVVVTGGAYAGTRGWIVACPRIWDPTSRFTVAVAAGQEPIMVSRRHLAHAG